MRRDEMQEVAVSVKTGLDECPMCGFRYDYAENEYTCPKCRGSIPPQYRGDDDDEPKTTRTRNGRPKKEPRIPWAYFPIPNVVIDDPDLSGYAKLVAAVIARKINFGKWNTDLHVDLTDGDIAGLASISLSSAKRGRIKLKQAGYIESESLGRGGNRIRFTDKVWRNNGDE